MITSKVVDVVRKSEASAISGVRGVPMADDLQVGWAAVEVNRMLEFSGLRRIHGGDATALIETLGGPTLAMKGFNSHVLSWEFTEDDSRTLRQFFPIICRKN